MLRRSDILGIIGFTMMAAGAVLFLAVREDALPLYWLLGTTAWFIGFGVFLGWMFWRVGTFAERPAVLHPTHHKV